MGTLLAAVTLTPASFTQSYTDTNFFFVSPVSLLSGTTYFAALTSPVGTRGSKQYFIKDGGPVITDAGGIPIDPPPIGGDGSGPVPEPSTLGLLRASLLGLAAFRRLKP
ncbi:MAG: PEP-CTERM sorting domain-containing protein [Bryobacteraceae bacterium]